MFLVMCSITMERELVPESASLSCSCPHLGATSLLASVFIPLHPSSPAHPSSRPSLQSSKTQFDQRFTSQPGTLARCFGLSQHRCLTADPLSVSGIELLIAGRGEQSLIGANTWSGWRLCALFRPLQPLHSSSSSSRPLLESQERPEGAHTVVAPAAAHSSLEAVCMH